MGEECNRRASVSHLGFPASVEPLAAFATIRVGNGGAWLPSGVPQMPPKSRGWNSGASGEVEAARRNEGGERKNAILGRLVLRRAEGLLAHKCGRRRTAPPSVAFKAGAGRHTMCAPAMPGWQ